MNKDFSKVISDFKGKDKKKKTRIIISISLIVIFTFLSVFANILFPGTQFALVIDNSIGKFFNFLDFFTTRYVDILESLSIILFTWVLAELIKILIIIFTRKGKRSETVGKLVISIVRYTAIIVASFMILGAWGVNTPTLLASAGIIGLALSFGAQSLIEDVISGLFIIFENQFSIGDIIEIGTFRGTVVEIGVRVTKFQDLNGDIKIVNNSDIRGAVNTSDDLSLAICDVSIAYEEDINRVEKIMIENLPNFKEKIENIVEGPFYKGVQKLGDSSVVIRIIARSEELKKYQVVRDMNKEIKILFDKNNIKIPFPQIVVHNAKE